MPRKDIKYVLVAIMNFIVNMGKELVFG